MFARFWRAIRRRFFCARGRHRQALIGRYTSWAVWWDCDDCGKGLRYNKRED
jgi:hypothetical protein